MTAAESSGGRPCLRSALRICGNCCGNVRWTNGNAHRYPESMRFFWLITFLALHHARAQASTALAETMKSIQDTLNQQGPVKWVQTARNAAADPMSVTSEVSGATADVNACTLSFEADTSYPNY